MLYVYARVCVCVCVRCARATDSKNDLLKCTILAELALIF